MTEDQRKDEIKENMLRNVFVAMRGKNQSEIANLSGLYQSSVNKLYKKLERGEDVSPNINTVAAIYGACEVIDNREKLRQENIKNPHSFWEAGETENLGG